MAPKKDSDSEKTAASGSTSTTTISAPKPGSHCISSIRVNLPVKNVVVHPLVLLSVVDHFNRVSKTTAVKRVVGMLLGSIKPDKTLDIANSFAVPFEENEWWFEDFDTWFLDLDYVKDMYAMFYKVAAKEKVNDIDINEQLKPVCPNPVLVIIHAVPKDLGLPTEAYIEVQEVHGDGTLPIKTFEHVPSEIGAEEAEEVCVEHLLRDIKDQTAGTLSQRVTDQLMGLRGLGSQLAEIQRYLREVSRTQLPVNHAVIYYIQEMLNLLPDVTTPEFVEAHNVQTNDQLMCVYLGSLLAFQKVEKEREEGGAEAEKKKAVEKDKEAKEGAKKADTGSETRK
ncbi:26S proteasome non-ATPase regulatory subunit 7 [Aphelenchoides avenae]|nr:26S proteasome non-ATPase regulatory subunit 7 [Aphelenchus avenae]